jgi:hypothetical protein
MIVVIVALGLVLAWGVVVFWEWKDRQRMGDYVGPTVWLALGLIILGICYLLAEVR